MRPPRLANPLTRALVVPAALAVASFAPACGGKDGTTHATTEAPTTSETGTTGSTTTPTTTGDTTDTSSSTTTGELPDCPVWDDDDVTCSSHIECIYLLNQKVCIVRCNYFTDQTTCEEQAYCYWEDGCYLAV